MFISAPMTDRPADTQRFRFRRSQRLRLQHEFDAVYGARAAKTAGPLLVFSLPNELGFCRLGLSVSRKVGGAVVRNRVKRLLRESFRLDQAEYSGGYDLVVVVRPHALLKLEAYRELLAEAVRRIDRHWTKREGKG